MQSGAATKKLAGYLAGQAITIRLHGGHSMTGRFLRQSVSGLVLLFRCKHIPVEFRNIQAIL
jgi:hypothetical protein